MKRLALIGLLIAPLPATADGYGFMTPSGNIYCNGAVLDGHISCSIIERSGPPAQPQPNTCAGTWGNRFELAGTGKAKLACDHRPPQPVDYSDLAGYGQTAELGPITCSSERTGLTCRNQSGHGFFLSRRKQELF